MTSTPQMMQMHSEHLVWESEISMWRDDLSAWQHELATVQKEIKELEQALQKHALMLRQHAAAARLQEQMFTAHEHAIAEYERGGQGDELWGMAQQHSIEADHHARHRLAHEQLKHRHHTITAHWNVLLKALREHAAESEASSGEKTIVAPKP